MRPLSVAAADRELTARETAVVRAHLDGCPACRSLFTHDAAFIRSVRQRHLASTAPDSLRLRVYALLRYARPLRTDA